MAIAYERHRITVDEYHRMANAFDPDARIELLDGELIETIVTTNPPHASVVQRLTEKLVTELKEHAMVRCQMPITLPPDSEPEPDVAVVLRADYAHRHPSASEVRFLIEVSDATRDLDVRKKIPLYARKCIKEVWLVDLIDDKVVVYREPRDGRFDTVRAFHRGEIVAPLAFPNVTLAVEEILPRL